MQDPAKRFWPGAQTGSNGAVRRVAVQDPARREWPGAPAGSRDAEYSEWEQERHYDQRKHGAAATAGDWATQHHRQRKRSEGSREGITGHSAQSPARTRARARRAEAAQHDSRKEAAYHGIRSSSADKSSRDESSRDESRASATTNGCQGTEPGHKEFQSEKEEVKQRETEREEVKEEPEDEEVKQTGKEREGEEEDPEKWLTKGRKRRSRRGTGEHRNRVKPVEHQQHRGSDKCDEEG